MRELINITTYPVPHNNGTGGGGGKTYVTYNGNTGINNSSANSGRMNFNSVNGGEGQFTYILAQEGTIIKLEGDELNYNFGYIGELESDNIKTGKLAADDAEIVKAWIETLDSKKITTEYLTVTKQAHFFELIIDKVRAVGGQIILTPAQCVADVVIARTQNEGEINLYQNGVLRPDISSVLGQVAFFDIYFRSDDEVGRHIDNEWLKHDQAFCQSFNISEGVYRDVANKYYWRHVDDVLPDKMVNFVTHELKNVGDTLASTNNIHISLAPTSKDNNLNGITWQAAAQNVQGIYSTVQWNNISGTSNAINGVMKTDSIFLGIQITPTSENKYFMTDKLEFQMYYTDENNANHGTPEGMKIGVYYNDGTSEYFSNLTFDGNCNTILNLNSNNPIEAIVVVCTQPVQWHQCHAIRLSNSNMDEMLTPQASIPESGDNIVQLGYQATGPSDPNAEVDGYSRQSAIIIAAYHTPDADLTAPSYAQYMGINDYHLRTHRGSYIDGKGAEFLGDIRMSKTVLKDDNGQSVMKMSEFLLDEQQIKTTVTELIRTENDHYTQNSTAITQNARQISLVAQQVVDGDAALQAAINVQADAIRAEVRDRQSADRELTASLTLTAQQIRSEVSSNYVSNSALSSYDYASKTYVNQTADNITSSVSRTYVSKDTYNSDIDDLEDEVNGVKRSYVQKTEMSQYYDSWQIAAMQEDIDGANQIIQAAIEVNANGRITMKSAQTDIRDANSSNGGILNVQNYSGTTTMSIVGGNGTLQTSNSGDGREMRLNHSSIRFTGGGNSLEMGMNSSNEPFISSSPTININGIKSDNAIRVQSGSNYIEIGIDSNGAYVKSNCWAVQSGSNLTGSKKSGRITAPNGSSDYRACFKPG